jgi:opacity protein-like surface antigen
MRACAIAAMGVMVGVLGAASARAEPDFARDGWYVGVGASYAKENIDAIDDDGFGISGYFGYRFLRYFAAECEVEWIPLFEQQYVKVDRMWTAHVNAKAYLPLGRFQPFVSAGMGLMQARVRLDHVSIGAGGAVRTREKREEGAFAGRLGGGFDVYLTENVVLSASAKYTIGTGGLDDFEYVSAGGSLQYRFWPTRYRSK